MFELIKASPILGLGPANYYYYTPLYPILGWVVNFNSHNNYVDIAAQMGLVGLAIFAWLVIEVVNLGLNLRKRVKDGFCRGYIYAVMGGIAGMLVSGFMADWFLPFLYNIGIPGFRTSILAWLFIGGMIALIQITREKQMALV
jgi:O-antigen ligase